MRKEIYGHGEPHSDTAISLWNIGVVYHMQNNPNQAAEVLEQSLEMLHIMHGRNSRHSRITTVLCDLAKVYEDERKAWSIYHR